MQQVLQPIMNDLTSLREDMTSLSETMSQQYETLRGDLEGHKNWTTSELADLQTSLQSSIDNPPINKISRAVRKKLL